MSKCDAGDPQVHGPNANAALLKYGRNLSSFLIKGQQVPVTQHFDASLKTGIDQDLARRSSLPSQQRKPALSDLFDRQNGGKEIQTPPSQPSLKIQPTLSSPVQFSKVIGVQDDQGAAYFSPRR